MSKSAEAEDAATNAIAANPASAATLNALTALISPLPSSAPEHRVLTDCRLYRLPFPFFPQLAFIAGRIVFLRPLWAVNLAVAR